MTEDEAIPLADSPIYAWLARVKQYGTPQAQRAAQVLKDYYEGVDAPLEVGDVVQLDPAKTANPMFAGCMLVVTEVKEWGVQGYVQGLGQDGKPAGQAYYRAETGTFEYVGSAPWVIA